MGQFERDLIQERTRAGIAAAAQLVPVTAPLPLPVLIAAAGDQAGRRFLEFFAGTIRNPHTRRAYARAVAGFLAWCDERGLQSIVAVQPLHVATWIEPQTRESAAPSVNQQLAAIRHLFHWLITGQVIATNPAASVPGPSRVATQLYDRRRNEMSLNEVERIRV